LSVSKKIFCLSSIFSWVTTMCSYFLGQPLLWDGVLVVVGVGTAVVVLEPVLVLGLVRAAVDGVGEPVGVVVGIRTAVFVLEPVAVLGLVRTLVGGVGNAVPVVVGIGAAVRVLEAVLVLGIVRALVDRVEDAVVIAVPGDVALAHRQPVGGAGVAVGDLDVVAGPEVVPLIELARGELDVGLGQGELARRAAVGAVVARLLGDHPHLAHVRF
jgi:hypothetical protein